MNLCKYIMLLILIICISFLLLTLKENENFSAPSDTDILNIQLDENRERYKKIQDIQKKILEEDGFQIGYKEVENTDSKTIGVCPLGQYFNGEVPEEIDGTDLKKCTQCTKCNPGYYLKEGCSGNSDSVCHPDKVDYSVFLKSHDVKYKELHDVIHPHKHSFFHEMDSQGEQTHLLSSHPHRHLH